MEELWHFDSYIWMYDGEILHYDYIMQSLTSLIAKKEALLLLRKAALVIFSQTVNC